jgi:HlyD family secretion protein
LEGAKLNVKKAEAAELSMAAHRQKIQLLHDGLALAKKDQERILGLPKDMATDQERERQALVVQQAASELASAKAMLLQLQSANELGLEAANLELRSAETQYARTQVSAPCEGSILKIYIRPGETIGPKPILQMADLDRMVVVAEVYENEVQHLSDDQPAQITSKAFPPPYDKKGVQGKVARIGRMISVPVLKSVDPFAPADRHVVEVRIDLDADGSRQSATLSNLQVDVRFPKRN